MILNNNQYMPTTPKNSKAGLRTIAIFEAIKGFTVLAAGLGLLGFIHQDLHSLAIKFLQSLHLNPAKNYSKIFISAADHISDGKLWLLAILAVIYATVRFVEAFGLWRQRRWAEWFGVISGGIYIPIEIYEIILKANVFRVSILLINLAVITFLLLDLRRSKAVNSKK